LRLIDGVVDFLEIDSRCHVERSLLRHAGNLIGKRKGSIFSFDVVVL
jgi:hypothetical protein